MDILLLTIFIYIHVVSAVISVGPLVALLPIISKMEKTEEANLSGFVQAFQISITVVKHAGHVLVISGVILIGLSAWTWTSSWIVLTIALMVGSIVFLARAFKPTLQTYGTPEFNKEKFIAKLRNSTIIYITLLLIMLWLMVDKPILW
ncbi:hypothetical protein ACOQFO_09730 [Ureibacillus sp. MALMAid1270]|uniref:hypothetical protein n=1 Tax=Ureibacillus sp. MALMAid1270 TaxID=3411629 RepID=UPI003BA5F97F